MAVAKKLLLVSIALLCSSCYSEEESSKDLPGHMQPLGSHMEPELVRKVDHMLTPLEFYEDYVVPKKPVIFEGLMSKLDVIKNWQSDDYLRSHFGDASMNVEHGKKENRSEYGFGVTMAEFLDRYKHENIYMVSDLSTQMYNEWRLPKFLLCGGFTDQLMFVYLWFSSGGTKSVVHSDSYENLHCLVSGQKKFVLIEPHYSEDIGPEHEEKGFYDIDVEKVNMTAYPNLAKTPWYQATVNPGDCLYLPYLWLHNVNSVGRNMGVNVWWQPITFRPEDCPPDLNELPDFGSLGDINLAPELQLKEALQMVAKDDGTVHAKDMYEMMSDHIRLEGLLVDHVKELFDMMQPGSNGVLTDIDNISKAQFAKGFTFIADISDELQNEKFAREARQRGFDEDGQPLTDEEYFEEFGGQGDEEDMWEGPVNDHMTEGGGDYEENREHRRDEL